jgi:type IV fimbrial biogenesis protein FimT
MKKRLSGFTLIELLVVLAIAGILASLALPSFRTMLAKRTVLSVAQNLTTDIRFTRSEALRRLSPVSICSLAANSTDTCSVAGSDAWKNGWMIFVDTANRGVRDAGEEIIRVEQAPSNIASIASTDPTSDRRFLIFEANGFGKSINQTFFITPTGSDVSGAVRLVCISLQGRPSLRAEGFTACEN